MHVPKRIPEYDSINVDASANPMAAAAVHTLWYEVRLFRYVSQFTARAHTHTHSDW